MKKNLRSNLTAFESVLLLSASDIACFFAALIIVSSILLAFKISISSFDIVAATFVTIIFNIWLSYKIKADFFVQIIAVSIGLSVGLLSFLSVSTIYDTSYDGQAYHQDAVVLLDYGWNPLYTKLTNEATANMEFWLNHYPKGNWIIAADIYKVSRNIESGKILSLLSAYIAFAFCLFGIYRLKVNIAVKWIIAAVLSFNPVFVYQSLSYYADGVVVSLLLALVFISIRIVTRREKFLFWPFLFVSLVLINLKLAALVFFAAVCVCMFMYAWFADKLRTSLWYARLAIISLVVGAGLVGYNPYMTNYVGNGHMLYPAMGKGAYDYEKTNVPQNFWNVLPPFRLIASIYSKSSLARGEGKNAEFKLPFVVSEDELVAFRETNAKTGGFGPLYAMAFSLAILGVGFYLLSEAPKTRHKVALVLGVIALLGLASPLKTSSVARYVPFVWWIPGLVVMSLATLKSKAARIYAGVIAAVLIVNTSLVGAVYYPNTIRLSQQVFRQLAENAAQGQVVRVNVGQFGSTKIKLLKYGIQFVEVYPDEECKNGKRFLAGNVARICEPL